MTERILYYRRGHEQSEGAAQIVEQLRSMNVNINLEDIDVMKIQFAQRHTPMPSWLEPGMSRIPMLAEIRRTENTPLLTAGLAAIIRLQKIAEEAVQINRSNSSKRRTMLTGDMRITNNSQRGGDDSNNARVDYGGGPSGAVPPPMSGLFAKLSGDRNKVGDSDTDDGDGGDPRSYRRSRDVSPPPPMQHPSFYGQQYSSPSPPDMSSSSRVQEPYQYPYPAQDMAMMQHMAAQQAYEHQVSRPTNLSLGPPPAQSDPLLRIKRKCTRRQLGPGEQITSND